VPCILRSQNKVIRIQGKTSVHTCTYLESLTQTIQVNRAQKYRATLLRLVGFYNLKKTSYISTSNVYALNAKAAYITGFSGGTWRGEGQITVSTAPLMKHNTQWPTLLHPLLLHTLSLYTLTPLLAAFPTRDVATEHLQQHTRSGNIEEIKPRLNKSQQFRCRLHVKWTMHDHAVTIACPVHISIDNFKKHAFHIKQK
jgi:hypothetical protein